MFAQKQSKKHKQPNVVIIMADDMGYECLGCNGSTEYSTPNLDQLAAEGVRFTNCISQPLCTPSRVKIMTGQGNYRNYVCFGYLDVNQKTFGNLFKNAGYATCISGKWQLNGITEERENYQDVNRPHHFGFDEYCLWQMVHEKRDGERFANPMLTQNGKDLPRNEDAYGPDIVNDFVLDFIDRKADEPFFVYYPMLLVHDPFVPTPDSPEWADKSRRYENDTTYFADMMAYTDKMVQKVIDKLKAKGVWENTILIFTADNGTHRSVYTQTTSGVVRGAKGFTNKYGIHVPMIASYKGKSIGSVADELVSFADILPTICEAAGINENQYLTDGNSFLHLIKGQKGEINSELVMEYPGRFGGNKGYKGKPKRWVMNKDYKLYNNGRFYNIVDDPNEKSRIENLTEEELKIKEHFQHLLDEKEKEFPIVKKK
ncbi:arylsulfatase A [Labilibacter sediminis]|nr:arylsulfatase A [Labilibacter sediminis]